MAMRTNSGRPESIGQVFHKEKNQKKYNKTIGQLDNLKGYGNEGNMSTAKSTQDKMIKREANFLKNIAIDEAYKRLLLMNLVNEPRYESWYFKCFHTLGVQYVMAQADLSMKNARDKNNPAPLFHFLLNKAMNKAVDPYMPRFK